MALNKGQLYERSLFRQLKIAGKIPFDIHFVEQIPGQDITVFNRNGQSGLEVKGKYTAAFGSGTLKFDNSNKQSPWKLTESDEDDDENTSKELMRNFARQYRLVEKVNKNWYKDNRNYYPFYLEESKEAPLKSIIKIPKSKRGKQDQEALGEFRIKCSNSKISQYYISKGSHYIQIKGKGIYWFGGEDPLQISNNISKFSPTETYIRVRVQSKGSGSYNFSYGLYIGGISPSIADLDRNLNII